MHEQRNDENRENENINIMNKLEYPDYKDKKRLFAFLVENKDKLIAQKKSFTKHADGFSFNNSFFNLKNEAIKASSPSDLLKFDELLVKPIINTTKLMDSHYDVHLDGLWKKTLSENKMIMHVREHQSQKYDYIISDGEDLKVYTKKFTWKELGYDFKGETEALIFDSIVKRDRNAYMFNQYAKGYVRNHSVGMRYVKLVMAINDEDYGAEYEAWEKYFDLIANKEFAEEIGFFWAVKEAKVIEGSAVPLGSNYATPTYSTEGYKNEPSINDTQKQDKEPQSCTLIDYEFLNKNFKL